MQAFALYALFLGVASASYIYPGGYDFSGGTCVGQEADTTVGYFLKWTVWFDVSQRDYGSANGVSGVQSCWDACSRLYGCMGAEYYGSQTDYCKVMMYPSSGACHPTSSALRTRTARMSQSLT